jgi:DNA-binding response OmpR family regulator
MLAASEVLPMEKRVLVVDDDPPTRQMIAAVLSRAGFTVDLCADGAQALGRLDHADYGAVVLALVQRDAEGDAEIFARLDAKEAPPSVVVISAGAQAAMEAIASDLIYARLRKPFHIEDLVGAVKGCFT